MDYIFRCKYLLNLFCWVEQKDEKIKILQHECEEKAKQIKELENNLRKKVSKVHINVA